MKMYAATIPAASLKIRSREAYYAGQKHLFVFVVILVAIVPLLLISWSAAHFYKKSWLDKTIRELTSLANSRREIIDLFLDNQKNLLSAYTELHDFDWLKAPGNLEKLFKTMSCQGVIVDLGLIGRDGSHLRYTGPFAERLRDKNYAGAPWFTEVMQSGRYVSDVFTGYRGVPHFVVAVADPSRSWVLRATINSTLFHSLLASAEVGPGGDAFILNRQGVLQTPSRQGMTVLPAKEKHLLRVGAGPVAHSTPDFLYVSTGLNDNDWVLVLKTDIRTSLDDYYRARQRDAAIIVGAALLILVVSTVLVRSMMNRVQEADRQRMLLYDRIRHSDKMALIGRMAASVAHEINNPLQIIGDQTGWVTELLEEEEASRLKNGAEYRAAFEKIKTQVRRASTITHRLLGFSRRSEGGRTATDINALMEETISFLEKEAKNHRIAIHRDLSPDLPPLVTDGTQLQQVFLNILNNAFDAIGQDGSVSVRTRLAGGGLVAEFADSGPGLPDDAMQKIFEPFYTTKKSGGGTGIGLAISQSIMERLGGGIEAENRAAGGCLFRVRVPLSGQKNTPKGEIVGNDGVQNPAGNLSNGQGKAPEATLSTREEE